MRRRHTYQDTEPSWGFFVLSGVLILALNAAILAGAIWLVVTVLRALNVL